MSRVNEPDPLPVRVSELVALCRRLDGLEAVAGELRARLQDLEAGDALAARVGKLERGARAALEEIERRVAELERDR